MAGKFSLFIGNNEYEDGTLSKLKTPAADVHALAGVMRDPEIGGFDEVTELINQDETSIRRAISRFFMQKRPDDLLLLYFSGHGVLDDQGRLFLAVKDTHRGLLKATAIPAGFVTGEMDDCRSKRQILILDCCHSGAFIRGGKGQASFNETTFKGNGYGRVVLTASNSTQYALEGDRVIKQAELSLFSHYLLEGLVTGEADVNNDGLISLDDWYDYTYAKIVTQTPQQTPQKWSYSQQGDLIVAKNPRPKVIRAAELPIELRQSIESSYAMVREGAAQELGRLLKSSDKALALAALDALKSLTEDDSRKVQSLAIRILAEHEEQGKKTTGGAKPEAVTTVSVSHVIEKPESKPVAAKEVKIIDAGTDGAPSAPKPAILTPNPSPIHQTSIGQKSAFRLWLRWTLSNCLGWAIGLPLSASFAGIFNYSMFETMSAVVVFTWIVAAIVLMGIRKVAPSKHRLGLHILVCSIGAALGLFLGYCLVRGEIIFLNWSLPAQRVLGLLILVGAVSGIIPGVTNWLASFRQIFKAKWKMPYLMLPLLASGISALVAALPYLNRFFNYVFHYSDENAHMHFGTFECVLGGVLGGGVAGAITGIFLVRAVRRAKSQDVYE